ncbi:MAG: hypothetical protein FJ290_14165 [Planctomycetes bacterium]|nr:hypothetical protein [Planctomycetota bacterium]
MRWRLVGLCVAVAALGAPGLKAAEKEDAPKGPPVEWVSLYNERDLDGWREARGGPFAGRAAVKEERLHVRGEGGPAGIVCTREVPRADYELHIVLRRHAGAKNAGTIVFPVGEDLCEWVVAWDSAGGLRTVDGKDADDPTNPTRHRRGEPGGDWLHCILRVEADRIQAWAQAGMWDIERVIDLPRKGHKFAASAAGRALAPLGYRVDAGAECAISAARVRKLGAKAGWDPEWTSLYDGIGDRWRPVKGGRFASAPSSVVGYSAHAIVLMSRADIAAGLAYIWDFPKTDYELAFTAERIKGAGHSGSVVFPVGDAHCAWAIGDLGKLSGLDMVDGKRHTDIENPTRKEIDLGNRSHRCRLRVAAERVEGWIDDDKVIDLPTKGHRLALSEGYEPLRPFGFFTERHTSTVLSDIYLRRLNSKAPAAVRSPRRCLLKVSAFVDGVSDLVIGPGALHWEHQQWQKPSQVKVNGAAWDPQWKGNTSEPLRLPELPSNLEGLTCSVTKPRARGRIFVQDATPRGIVVRFDDHRHLGADTFYAELLVAPAALVSLQLATYQALDALDKRNFEWAAGVLERALREAHRADAREFFDGEVWPLVMARAVEACRGLAFDKAAALLDVAERLRPKDPDIAALRRWMREVGEPLFEDSFLGGKLDAWESPGLDWRVDNAGSWSWSRLVCEAGFVNAEITVKGKQFQDFLLGFDVDSRGDRAAFRMGALFRRRPERFLYCLLSHEQNAVFAGGAIALDRGPGGQAEGVEVKYVGGEPAKPGGRHYPIEKGRMYRVSVWAVGKQWQCYVDGELVAEGTDAEPVAGQLSLFTFAGRAAFDHLVVCRPVPFPRLQFALPK